MKSQILKSPLPYLALFGAYLIWGANYAIAKIALNEFPPMSLAFLRFTFGFLLLIPFLLVMEKKIKVKIKDVPRLFLVGILMVTFNIAFFYEGLKRTLAIDASVLFLIVPIMSVLGGWWFLKEKIYWTNLMGVFFAVLGGSIVIGLPLIFTGNVNVENLLGNFLIILSGICSVAGILLAKNLLKDYPPLFLSAIMFFIGSITFLIPSIYEYIVDPTWVQRISILGILGLLYITILSSVCAYFLLTWGVSKIEVHKASLVQYIEPAIAASIAVPLLGERISYSFIVGTCLIVLGVYWGTLGKVYHHHLYHKHHRS